MKTYVRNFIMKIVKERKNNKYNQEKGVLLYYSLVKSSKSIMDFFILSARKCENSIRKSILINEYFYFCNN